ncbi:MAG: hypothetical protein K0S41_3390 [Anaerocolumna sp.]|jgi:hypothetical protein|nr:hypothetical protein [Anaerocolumna sp.]
MKHIIRFFSAMIACGFVIIMGLWAGNSGISEKLELFIEGVKEKIFKGVAI